MACGDCSVSSAATMPMHELYSHGVRNVLADQSRTYHSTRLVQTALTVQAV